MNRFLDLILDNVSFILISAVILTALYYALISKTKNHLTDKLIERYQQVLEVTLSGASIVEAVIASRIAAEEELADTRFMLHIILVFLSMVTGFRISKEITEVVISFFSFIQSLVTFKIGEVVYATIAFLLQIVGAVLTVVATLAGPIANWLLIAQSQGDVDIDLDITSIDSFSDVLTFNYISIQFAGSVHDWTFSSFAVLFIHLVVILILTITSADKLILGGLKDLDLSFKPKDVLEGYENLEPRDFGEVFKYINKNTDRTIRDLNLVTGEYGKVPKVERVPRKQQLQELVHRAIVFREKKDIDGQKKAHLQIETLIDAWLEILEEKPEKLKSVERKVNEKHQHSSSEKKESPKKEEEKKDEEKKDDD